MLARPPSREGHVALTSGRAPVEPSAVSPFTQVALLQRDASPKVKSFHRLPTFHDEGHGRYARAVSAPEILLRLAEVIRFVS